MLDKLNKWIDEYLIIQKNKYSNNIIVQNKLNHINRTYLLALKLYPNNHLLQVAMKFHDIGRFIQYEKISCFDDMILSHYTLGSEYIDQLVIDSILPNCSEIKLIQNVIKYHNGIQYIPEQIRIDQEDLNLIDLACTIDSLDNGCLAAVTYLERECLTDAKNYKKNNPDLDMKKVSDDVLNFYLSGESFNKFKYCKTYADYVLFAASLCIKQLNSPYKKVAKQLMNNKIGKYNNVLEGYKDIFNKFIDNKVADTCYQCLLKYYSD